MSAKTAKTGKITKRRTGRNRMEGDTYAVKRDGVVIGWVIGDQLRGYALFDTARVRLALVSYGPGLPDPTLEMAITRLTELIGEHDE